MALLAKPMRLSVADAEELGRHFITPIILLLVFAVLGLLVRFRRDAGLCFAVFAIFPLLLFTLNFGAIEVIFNIQIRPPAGATNSCAAARNQAGIFSMFSQRTAILSESHGHFDHQGWQ